MQRQVRTGFKSAFAERALLYKNLSCDTRNLEGRGPSSEQASSAGGSLNHLLLTSPLEASLGPLRPHGVAVPQAGSVSSFHLTQTETQGRSRAWPWDPGMESWPPRAHHSPAGQRRDRVIPVPCRKCCGSGPWGRQRGVWLTGRGKNSSRTDRASKLKDKEFSGPDMLRCVTVLLASWDPRCFQISPPANLPWLLFLSKYSSRRISEPLLSF